MNLPKWLTEVTPLSKYLALSLFITLPVLSFYSGMKYQERITTAQKVDTSLVVNPTSKVPSSAPNDSPINLKEYESKKFFFKFQYPSSLILDTQYESVYPGQGSIHIYPTKDRAMEGGSFIEISSYENKEGLTLLEWAKKNNAQSNFKGEYYPIIIGGEKGMIYEVIGQGSGLQALVSKNNFIYSISDLGYDNEMRMLLKTFKFTK